MSHSYRDMKHKQNEIVSKQGQYTGARLYGYTVKYEKYKNPTSLPFAAAGFSSDPDRLQVECDLFAEHIDYVEDVCKLISHVAVREADRVRAKHGQVSDKQSARDDLSRVCFRSISTFMGRR